MSAEVVLPTNHKQTVILPNGSNTHQVTTFLGKPATYIPHMANKPMETSNQSMNSSGLTQEQSNAAMEYAWRKYPDGSQESERMTAYYDIVFAGGKLPEDANPTPPPAPAPVATTSSTPPMNTEALLLGLLTKLMSDQKAASSVPVPQVVPPAPPPAYYPPVPTLAPAPQPQVTATVPYIQHVEPPASPVAFSLDILGIPGLAMQPSRPTMAVTFRLADLGEQTAHYHWVVDEKDGLFLIFDTRYDYPVYVPPNFGSDRKISVSLRNVSPPTQSVLCYSAGMTFSFGVFRIIPLIKTGELDV